jgi:succinylarginine dihydrolase
VLFCHQLAFENQATTLQHIRQACADLMDLSIVEVPESEVPLSDAIKSYLFNTQLLEIESEDRLVLLAPVECRENPATARYLEALVAGNGPIGRVMFVDVRQSMRNGGGPACLRLRVVMHDRQKAALGGRTLLDETLFADLTTWISQHYRETLSLNDLADPHLLEEGHTALDQLSTIMKLGSGFYPFQRA